MGNWDKTNYAQWGTYRALVVNKEIDATLVSFVDSENYRMPGLSYYVISATTEDLTERSELVAMELFNFIVVNYSPAWQNRNSVDSTRAALNKFIDILKDKDKTIRDLSNEVDKVFKFSNE